MESMQTISSEAFDPVVMQSVPELDVIPIVLGLLALVLISSAVYARQRGQTDDVWSISDLTEEQTEVVTLIANNDGEIQQKLVSDELDWSDAKTSRITSELIDINAVNKTRKDRQNYISINEENQAEN